MARVRLAGLVALLFPTVDGAMLARLVDDGGPGIIEARLVIVPRLACCFVANG